MPSEASDGPHPQRVTPLAAGDWGEKEHEAYASLLGFPVDQVPRAGSRHRYDPLGFDVVGVMVRNPALAKAFWRFNNYLLQRGTLPVRLRELVILRVAYRRRSSYEWGQHVRMALEAGISEAEIDQIACKPGGVAGFEGAEQVALAATDELLDDGRIGDELWSELAAELDEAQVMELIFVVGTYTMLAMAFDTWGLPPEPGSAPLPPSH